MKPPCLLIAYSDERSRVASVTQSLRSQGHEVVVHDDARACLAAPEAGLYLLGRTLADGSSGLDLLEALRRTGRSAPVLLLAPTPDFAEVRRAVELGATEV